MLKEAIEKIEAMAKDKVMRIDGRNFFVGEDHVEEFFPAVLRPDCLILGSLEAMVKMVKTEGLAKGETPLYIQATSPELVECFMKYGEYEDRFLRTFLYTAKATDVPGWRESEVMSFESAMIALRTRFQETADTVYALKLLSDITTGSHVTFNDNGIATSVVTKKGIDLQANTPIKPIVRLKPYRTFQEVEQPESEFLIRVNEREIKFIEADGGMWRLAARKEIKRYFEEALAQEIEEGKVVVML